MEKKKIIYKGTSVKKYNEIRDALDRSKMKYKQYVVDAADKERIPAYMYFFTPVLFLAPRAFRGSRGIKGDELKTYLIYVKETDYETAKKIIS